MFKFLITLFLGWSGIHKFIERKPGLGILYLCTGGLCSLGWIYDTIKYGCLVIKSSKSSHEVPLPLEFEISGTYYHQPEMISIAKPNSAYASSELPDSKIYKFKYTRKDAVLIPEPTNPHDANAIIVSVDNVTIGYVPKEHCVAIHKLLESKSIKQALVKIYGGEYKCVDEHGRVVTVPEQLNAQLNIIL